MILTLRYPHVRDLVQHYATKKNDAKVLKILDSGLLSEEDASHLGHFIWDMLDTMAKDREQNIVVLGGTDNTQMAPDIAYEMDALMNKSGYGKIWEKISDEA
ncbi:hypothetical protein ACSV5M_21065 [Cellvibrio sp. ARAG 10.3]|uniref:hypothetical protein n=1 Tax=Cellvibrio sp. ARAG 10.3 TaxID=3451358 RepID=UPI003F4544A5